MLRGRRKRESQPTRLPIDVLVGGDDRGVPDLGHLKGNVESFRQQRAEAIVAGRFEDRAVACWGLVACGSESLPWCRKMLTSTAIEDLEDAVGVAARIGVPADWARSIEELFVAADDDRADLLAMLLPAEIAARLADDDLSNPPSPLLDGVPLDGRFEPFTSIIYFVEARLASVAQSRREWERSLPGGGKTRWSDHTAPLGELLALLEPFTMPSWKSLLVETMGEWTAVISHGSDLSYVAHFADLLDTRVMRTSWSPHVVKDGRVLRYGDTALWLWQPDGKGGRVQTRTLQASRQSSRWDWHEDGVPLPFEDVSRYGSARVRDGFNLATLNDYCEQLGIRRADAAFYGPNAELEEKDISSWGSLRSMPSSQWRAEHS